MSRRDFDVIIATDFRHGGGTTASIAQEIEIQARMGLRTGLVQVDAAYLEPQPWADRIRAAVAAGAAEVVPASSTATARLLVLRHPRVFEPATWKLAARGDRAVMVANQVPRDLARTTPYYDVAMVRARLREQLGSEPAWAPIGPVVRDAIAASRVAPEMIDDDWHNVIDAEAWAPRRPRPQRGPIWIGRHSRDDIKKWPERRADMLAAYPDDGPRRVRVLGGGKAVARLIGKIPRRWDVLPFGCVPPEEFLAGLDAYVYFHHSGMLEAFGRSVLEALAAGVPVVTHRYFARVFGDACHYAEPRGTPRVLDEVLAERGTVNQRGLDVVRDRYDWESHRRRLEHWLGSAQPAIVRRRAPRKRVLFISSNGGGLGHLTRLLAIARRLPADHEPMFLTMSTALDPIRKHGFWADYFASSAPSKLVSGRLHRYHEERVAAAIRAFRPSTLVFDGTFAYAGLLAAISRFPSVHKVWSRRGMWRPVSPNRVRHSLNQLLRFDLVVEPGELAGEVDTGATVAQRGLLRKIDPILLLDRHEQIGRAEARRELGIPGAAVAVLINLGAGNINRLDDDVALIVAELAKRPDVHLVAAQSLIAARALPIDASRVTRLETYPLGRVLSAFDLCIAAPGYNSFHELLAGAVPTLFVPNEDTALDDQRGRATWGAARGLCLTARAGDAEGLRAALTAALDPEVRRRLRERCRELPACDGARQAAELIIAGVTSGDHTRAAARRLLDEVAAPARWERLRSRAEAFVARLRTDGLLDVLLPDPPRQPTSVWLAPASDLAGRVKAGEIVEVEPTLAADDLGDRLELAFYALLKLRALGNAYRNVVGSDRHDQLL
jgi:hypothetical protein